MNKPVQFLKIIFSLIVGAAILSAGNQWAWAKHQPIAPDGRTNVEKLFCNSGRIVIKRDFDLNKDGVDDYTTYTEEGAEHPFAELFGPVATFEYGIIHGKRYDDFGTLLETYPTVCGALRAKPNSTSKRR